MVYIAPQDIQNVVNTELDVLLSIVAEEFGPDKAAQIKAKYKQKKEEE